MGEASSLYVGAGEHTRVSGMGPPVATRFSGNRGVLSVPYRRLFAGRLEAIPGAYIDKKYPTLKKVKTRSVPAPHPPARRRRRVRPARPILVGVRPKYRTPRPGTRTRAVPGPRSPATFPNLCSNDKSTYPGRKTGAPPLYFLPEPARPIIAIARMRRKGRWRTPAPGFFWLFAIRELVSPTILARSSQHLGGMVGEW